MRAVGAATPPSWARGALLAATAAVVSPWVVTLSWLHCPGYTAFRSHSNCNMHMLTHPAHVVKVANRTAEALANGVGRTPMMGWMAWMRFRCNQPTSRPRGDLVYCHFAGIPSPSLWRRLLKVEGVPAGRHSRRRLGATSTAWKTRRTASASGASLSWVVALRSVVIPIATC